MWTQARGSVEAGLGGVTSQDLERPILCSLKMSPLERERDRKVRVGVETLVRGARGVRSTWGRLEEEGTSLPQAKGGGGGGWTVGFRGAKRVVSSASKDRSWEPC